MRRGWWVAGDLMEMGHAIVRVEEESEEGVEKRKRRRRGVGVVEEAPT